MAPGCYSTAFLSEPDPDKVHILQWVDKSPKFFWIHATPGFVPYNLLVERVRLSICRYPTLWILLICSPVVLFNEFPCPPFPITSWWDSRLFWQEPFTGDGVYLAQSGGTSPADEAGCLSFCEVSNLDESSKIYGLVSGCIIAVF